MVKINRIVPNVFWCWKILLIRVQCLIQVQQFILLGLHYLTSCFHLFWKNILSAMYVDWGPPNLSLVVCYIFQLLIPLQCKIWFYKDCDKNCKNLVLDIIRTLVTSNQAMHYILQNICFSPLIDLDTLTRSTPRAQTSATPSLKSVKQPTQAWNSVAYCFLCPYPENFMNVHPSGITWRCQQTRTQKVEKGTLCPRG